MNSRVRELFETITLHKFDQTSSKFANNAADHWETFQEGFEAAVRECAEMVDRDGNVVLTLRILHHFGIAE
jgi:adenine-specific DNA methylase